MAEPDPERFVATAQTINARTRQHVFPDVDRVEMAHHFIEVRGATFHVAEAGQGEPLLLIHGYPQHWWVWRRVIPHFAGERRVICPDLRGFGWSDAPPDGPYDKESLVDDVIALLDGRHQEPSTPFRLSARSIGPSRNSSISARTRSPCSSSTA